MRVLDLMLRFAVLIFSKRIFCDIMLLIGLDVHLLQMQTQFCKVDCPTLHGI
jgi:hypothetical protein